MYRIVAVLILIALLAYWGPEAWQQLSQTTAGYFWWTVSALIIACTEVKPMASDRRPPPAGISPKVWEALEAERHFEAQIHDIDLRIAKLSAERWASEPPDAERAAELTGK